MASANEEFWTPETISLLIDKRIDRDPLFRTANSDQEGWTQVLNDLRKTTPNVPNTLNRIHIRRQWTKICEEYKKYVETDFESHELNLEDETFIYYKKLKTFFDNSLQQQRSKENNQKEDRCKLFAAQLLKAATEGRGITREKYKILKKIKNDSNFIRGYADRWSVAKTDLLIESRIARSNMFKGRGHGLASWRAVISDMIQAGESENLSITKIKKKWENLQAKYQHLKKRNPEGCEKWPHFAKLDNFFTRAPIKKRISSSKQESFNKSKNFELKSNSSDDQNPSNTQKEDNIYTNKNTLLRYAERWPVERTKLLIERKIARDAMFDGRRLSTRGWFAILQDLKKAGAPSSVTIMHIKKKWCNLFRKYKLLKNDPVVSKDWPFFKDMEEYFHIRKFDNPPNKDINPLELVSTSNKINDWENQQELKDQKLIKCRLCQQETIQYSLLENKLLCEKIKQCLSIHVLEDVDLLPKGLCNSCKEKLEEFHEFYENCHAVNKELIETLLPGSNSIKIEPDCQIEASNSLPEDNNIIYECSECPVQFTSTETLELHLKSHDKNKSRFFCEVCNSSFSRQSALYSHIRRHFAVNNVTLIMPDDDDEKNVFAASKDEVNIFEEEENQLELTDHIENPGEFSENEDSEKMDVTTLETVNFCEVCCQSFDSEVEFKSHLQQHSKTVLKCPRKNCGKTYMSLKSLQNHELKHLGVRSFLCDVCGKDFVTNNALKVHEKIHLEVKEHECEICSLRFSVLSNLRSHQRKHHEGHRFYCSQCPKEFLTKSSLKRHEIVHTGIKDFICDICSAAFYTAKELKKHKIYHDGTRLHHCNICFKTFFEKHHLTVHKRSHTDERPYPCKVPGCGKSFRESQKLTRHMKQQHRCST